MSLNQGISKYQQSVKLTSKSKATASDKAAEKTPEKAPEKTERKASAANAATKDVPSKGKVTVKAAVAKKAKAPAVVSAKDLRSGKAAVEAKKSEKTRAKAKAKGAHAEDEEETGEEEVAATQNVAGAIVQGGEAAAAAEDELTEELVAEMKQDELQTQGLVKADYNPTNASRDQLVVEYAPLIKYIAQKIAARLPTNIELDDLISSGVIGLMDAIEKYDASRDNKFKTYAEFRIRGAILDELRAQDWVPRSVREKAKVLERCYSRIEQQKGRQATDEEVCAELGISQNEYHDMLNQVRSVSLLSFDDVSNFSKADKKALHGYSEGNASKTPTPFNEVNQAALKKMIADAIYDLPEKQRLVLSLYYYEDLNLKEIGKVLDVTESRVSQLHTQAIIRLKAKLRSNWDDFASLFGLG